MHPVLNQAASAARRGLAVTGLFVGKKGNSELFLAFLALAVGDRLSPQPLP